MGGTGRSQGRLVRQLTESPSSVREDERRRFPPWAWVSATALAAVVLFFCYLRLSRTYADGSDGADQALQAWDLLHGNWLLRGWTIADVSFYTTEIPQYALVELVHGLGPGVVHLASAMTYTLLALCAGLLAKGRTTGRDGIVRALVAIGIVLAPQLGNGIHLLLSQPDHLGTQVPLLVIFIFLDLAPRRWYVAAAVAVLLTWVLVSDQVALFDAAAPLTVVCGIRALYAVVRDRKPLASQWFELSLAAAGVVSFGAAKLITAVITHAGGYAGLPLKTIPAPPHLLPAHFVLTMEGILSIYGADLFGVSAGNVGGPASGSLGTTVAVVIALVHLVGVGLAIWGVCRAFRRFFSSDLIASLLAAGIVINLAAYVFSIDPQTLFDTREIVALLPFGAVLAGRLLTGSLARARLEPVLVGVLACYVIALGYGVAQPAAVDLEQPVVGWLEAHHLYTGLGTYAEANIITLDSDGRVAIRTASWRTTGAVPRSFESKASWYDPRASYANFILSNSADGNNVSVVPMRDILPFAGPPAHVYHYKTFTIMVWNKNLLADLGSPPSSVPGNIR
jgi:hypothetical protein